MGMSRIPRLVGVLYSSLALVLVLLPVTGGAVKAADEQPPLSVDVWTDKGGQGFNAAAGTYQIGEETLVYFQVTTPCQVRLTVSGEPSSHSEEWVFESAGTYNISLGQAEEMDIGQWQVKLEAWTPGHYACDVTTFTVVAAGSAPAPPPPTGRVRGDGNGDGEITVVDAQCALLMAVGRIAEDLNMDVNGDGAVSSLDARKILRAVLGLEALP